MTKKLREDINLLLSNRGTMQGKPSRGRALRIVLFKAGAHALIFYRVYHYLYKKGLRFLPELLCRLNYTITGAEIDPGAEIGGGLRMPHPSGVIIGRGARVGNNVSILSSVVLGGSGKGIIAPGKTDGYPTIGDGVWLFTGAKVLGPVTVGDNSLVGANTVLTKSVPPESIVAPDTQTTIKSRHQEPNRPEPMPGDQESFPEEMQDLKEENRRLAERISRLEELLKEKNDFTETQESFPDPPERP